MRERDFADLSRSVVDEILSWDPSYATQLGMRKYDHHMMDPSKEAFDHQVARLSEFIEMVEEFEDGQLTPDQVIDRDLAAYMFRLRRFEISRLRIHEQTSFAEAEIGRALFFLFVRDDRPLEARMDAVVSRLDKTPEFLHSARKTLSHPYRMWVEMALAVGKELPTFIELIRAAALAELKSEEPMMRLSSAAEKAMEALIAYERWLLEDVLPEAGDENSISSEDLGEYMKLKEFDTTPDEAIEISGISLNMVNRQRVELAKKMDPNGTLSSALHAMKQEHTATFEGVLKAYREWIGKARDFVISRNLATVPDGEKLLVIETPQFMRRQAPFAAQYEPGKYSESMTGLFLVTPDESNPELLKEHCYAAIANTSVHEGYPGHHLQGICSNQNPSDIRTLSASPCFGEGWALYCEGMMFSQGFQKTDTGKLAQLNDLAFRIVRVKADVCLARKAMTPEEVADLLTRETGMERNAALDEARSYTQGITYYMSYFLGMLEMLRLREDVEAALGDRFDLRQFHDSLLNAGCLPMHYMRRVERLRLKRDHDVELPDPRESLIEYVRKRIDEGRGF